MRKLIIVALLLAVPVILTNPVAHYLLKRDASGLYAQGQSLLETGDEAAAAIPLREAAQLHPSFDHLLAVAEIPVIHYPYHDQRQIAERLVAVAEETADPLKMAQAYTALGTIQTFERDDDAQAYATLQKAADLHYSQLNRTAPGYIQTLRMMESLQSLNNRHAEAAKLGREIASVIALTQGTQNDAYSQQLSNIAHYERLAGNVDEAERLSIQALDIARSTGTERSPHYTHLLTNYAVFLEKTDRLDEAEDTLHRVLTLNADMPPEQRPSSSRAQRELADLLTRTDRFEQAVPLYQAYADAARSSWHKDGQTYVARMRSLAQKLLDHGQTDRAQEVAQQAIATSDAKLGPAHRTTLTARENYTKLFLQSPDQ